ncbi:hypothetical protein GCM10009547_21680 [Sporichthya brevicatena]|uniref:Uncharacterized protein n=1 Tax=Sporichthya brevicatena TaxID=171442 RepID=A0ABP3RVX4_9ACTN
MFGLKRDIGPHVRLIAPELGRRREPSPRLRAHRHGVDNILAEVMRIERTADGAASRLLASQLAEAAVAVLTELTGEDHAPLREKLANHAHLGCSVATAEDMSDGCAVGLTEPHVDTALLYLALENKVEDELMKAVTDWMMEAGYYLRRTGREVADVVPALRNDLPRLFPQRVVAPAPVQPASAKPAVPAQGQRRRVNPAVHSG